MNKIISTLEDTVEELEETIKDLKIELVDSKNGLKFGSVDY